MSRARGGARALARVRAVGEHLRDSRVGRALARYSAARGALMAGGIAYTGIFSVFAALTIGMSLLMATLGRDPVLRDAVVNAVNEVLPGMIKTDAAAPGLVTVDQLTLSSRVSIGSVVGALALLYTATGLMNAVKIAVRTMFGIVTIPQNAVAAAWRNLVGFAIVAVGVLVTALATLLTGALQNVADPPAGLTGPAGAIMTAIASFVIDAVVLGLVITVCGVRPPWRDLIAGSMIGALVFGALRQIGAAAVGAVASDPVLASVAAMAVLILWLHLASRVILLVSAWMANPPRPRTIGHPDELHSAERPNYVTLTVPETLAWPRQGLTGAVEVDPSAHPDYVPDARDR